MDLSKIFKRKTILIVVLLLFFILPVSLSLFRFSPMKFINFTNIYPAEVIFPSKQLPKSPKSFHKGKITCYFNDTTANPFFELNEMDPAFGSTIFFHETSCPSEIEEEDFQLKFRQACSVESALIAHPKNDVFLLVPRSIRVELRQSSNVFLKELLTYQNFKVRHINFERYLNNTPMKKIYQSGAISKSEWPVVHASDVLRYVTLYKFGGLYLDLDVVLKPLINYMSNFASPEGQEEDVVAAGVIHFGQDKIGREMAVQCAEEVSSTFDNRKWSHNSVGVLTRVLKKRCNVAKVADMTDERCKGFHVLPVSSFYPVHLHNRTLIFETGKTQSIKSAISQSYAIHIWNSASYNYALDGPDIPYLKLAEIYCPKIFNIYKERNEE